MTYTLTYCLPRNLLPQIHVVLFVLVFEQVLKHWQCLARMQLLLACFDDDDGFGNIYGNFPDALQVSQVLMNTTSHTGTHTPTLRQTREYVCRCICMSEYQMQHERTRKYTHIKKQNKCRKLTRKCMWHNSKNLLLQFVEFHFQFALEYFVVDVVVAELTVCGNLLQSCRLNVHHCPSLRRGRVRFSKIFYVTKLATNWEHRAEHKVSETREQQIESAANCLPKSTKRIGTSSAVKKDPHNHTQSSHSDEY